MKKILFFELKRCPYCIRARKFINELMAENPKYKDIEIEYIDERAEKERAATYDYYLVPCFYIDGKKVFEGRVSKKAQIEDVLKKAL